MVSNPPHFTDDWIGDLRSYDAGRHHRREFFANISRLLNRGGVVLQKNNRGSTAETFSPMMKRTIWLRRSPPNVEPNARSTVASITAALCARRSCAGLGHRWR